jgi:amidase/aspartyl-tRNA(Asn)/glutamyl-tRNA(Gln) amidotransferase subunit A
MGQITAEELISLGSRFCIDIDHKRAMGLLGTVDDMLESIQYLNNARTSGEELSPNPTTSEERTWSEPKQNPYGAIAVQCSVPPVSGGILDGVQVGIKDVISVAGVPMRCGSRTMHDFVATRDATVVRRLLRSGASITMKTACDEFAGSARGTTGYGDPITNPYDDERTAGGSSGGSASAVSMGQVDAALGTDTGGSVRIPASLCGVIGYKPTYGLIPLTGIVENTFTLDHVGIFANSVSDVAVILQVLAGAAASDPASMAAASRPEYCVGGYSEAVMSAPDASNLKIGVLEEGMGDGVSTEVIDRTEASVDALKDSGAQINSVSIDSFHDGQPIKNALSFVDLATHWRDGAVPYRRDGHNENYQERFSRARDESSSNLSDFYMSKLLAGAWVVEAQEGRPYVRARSERMRLRKAFENTLDDIDAILLPTMPDVAPPIDSVGDWKYDFARNTRAANVTHLPAVTLPNGLVSGLPVGLQLMGSLFADASLLSTAVTVFDILSD